MASRTKTSMEFPKVINILVLGETGVGKSTWINSLINSLTFTDLGVASQAQTFPVPIPSSFSFIDPEGEEKKIMIGKSDPNENRTVGKSTTEYARCHSYQVGEHEINLIDSPGIGDSEGIQEDKKNFDNILSHLAYFEEIHVVCILLKPNSSRLTVMFRFCIQELLTHLHSSVIHNIVFCFTNARSTFYRPGDTLPTLNHEMKNRNVGIKATPMNCFCFDSEPFRFLACLSNGVQFDEDDMAVYSMSWKESVYETKRLFRHISTLKPHNVKNTLCLNEARRIILAMRKSLAEIAKTIQHKIKVGEEAKRQIVSLDRDKNNIEKQKKEIFKRAVDSQIRELESENKFITMTSAKYGAFLKANAIIPYSNAVGDYLDMCIQFEKEKPKEIKNAAFLLSMEEMKRQYQEERRILDKAIASDGVNIPTSDDIQKLREQLYRLKHTGRNMKDLFDRISLSQVARNKTSNVGGRTTPNVSRSRVSSLERWIFE